MVAPRLQIKENWSSRSFVTGRQRQRIQRSQQAARRSDGSIPQVEQAVPQREESILQRESGHRSSQPQPPHYSLIAAEIRRPDYWRDISIEILGTILSALLIYGFGRVLGHIERPSVRSELLSVLGLLATVLPVIFAWGRLGRARAEHPGGSRGARFAGYLAAMKPHWTVPTLVIGVALCIGYL